MERFERQIRLPELGVDGQQKLQSARVLVAGAGGLGCPAILYLAAAGVGTIGIADGDRVTESNLNRQILFGPHDIGNSKAAAAARFVNDRYTDVRIQVYDKYLTVENLPALLPDYDLVIDGTDNFAARYMINDASVLFHKPLIYGAVYKYEGQAALFNAFPGSANYRDLYPAMPSPDEIPNCFETGVLGVLPGIIGTLQATEAIKWITGIGKPLINRVLFYNLKDHSVYETSLDPVEEFHSRQPATIAEFQATNYAAACGTALDIGWTEALKRAGREASVFIDIRDPMEIPRWNDQRCLEIPASHLAHHRDSFMKAKAVFLFCQHGIRSVAAARELRILLKRSDIYSVAGGILHPASPVSQERSWNEK